jgi:hypothetical protein
MELASGVEGLELNSYLTKLSNALLATRRGPDFDRVADITNGVEKRYNQAEEKTHQEVKAAYITVARNKLLFALYGREEDAGWITPPFPVFDPAREDGTCAK